MAHQLYQNFVLEAKLKELLLTKVGLMGFITHDNSLVANAGDKKTINQYNYTGESERVAKGAKNTESKNGVLSFTPISYDVSVSQHTLKYQDEDVYRDPLIVDFGLNSVSKTMINGFTKDYFTEAAKATLKHNISGNLSYDEVVDAIEKMGLEDGEEPGLYLLIPGSMKAQVRKDPDFKAVQRGAESLVIAGQIGWICGVPVAVSKACPAKRAYIGFPDAITLFTKKDVYIEQDRDIETRTNTVVSGVVNVMALTDATKIVEIVQA